ncbi:MAG: PTS sugar transporter subunit IIB [Defluviitaleaceae bacterium]|nr:PTS sugar transporter subunit IIB [Defluviitaleaceae bacterium]
MAVELVRIDDRLIHGQVATSWIRTLSMEQVIVVSDVNAGDPLQKKILNMAAPDGIKLHLFATDEFIEIYSSNPIKRKTMLIYTNPIEVLRCLKGGVKIDLLNVGGMKFTHGKERLSKSVSVTSEEKEAFKEIIEMGVDVEIRMLSNEKPTKLASLLT